MILTQANYANERHKFAVSISVTMLVGNTTTDIINGGEMLAAVGSIRPSIKPKSPALEIKIIITTIIILNCSKKVS